MSRVANVTKAQNALRPTLYGSRRVKRDMAIAQAESNVATLRDEFTQGLSEEIAKIAALSDQANRHMSDDVAKELAILSTVVFNLAGTLGQNCLQSVAASLYDLLLVMSERELSCTDPIVVHARAAQLLAPGMPPISGSQGQQLLAQLKDIIAHFRDKPDPCNSKACPTCPAAAGG
jgi:hypothetical protein